MSNSIKNFHGSCRYSNEHL